MAAAKAQLEGWQQQSSSMQQVRSLGVGSRTTMGWTALAHGIAVAEGDVIGSTFQPGVWDAVKSGGCLCSLSINTLPRYQWKNCTLYLGLAALRIPFIVP